MREGEGTMTEQTATARAVTLDVTDKVGLYVLTTALRAFQAGREQAAEGEGDYADEGVEPDVEWAEEQEAHARVAGALLEQVEAQIVAVHEAGGQQR